MDRDSRWVQIYTQAQSDSRVEFRIIILAWQYFVWATYELLTLLQIYLNITINFSRTSKSCLLQFFTTMFRYFLNFVNFILILWYFYILWLSAVVNIKNVRSIKPFLRPHFQCITHLRNRARRSLIWSFFDVNICFIFLYWVVSLNFLARS